VVHKLGFGASSTIWLARDKRLAKYVAINFAVSELDRPFDTATLRILTDEQGCNLKASTSLELIAEILQEFEVEGPKIQGLRRKHQCLVTTPARMCISEAREASYRRLFQPSVAHSIAAQVVRAVALMHFRGIVHAGR
jgi:serine/threonine protein kinase